MCRLIGIIKDCHFIYYEIEAIDAINQYYKYW